MRLRFLFSWNNDHDFIKGAFLNFTTRKKQNLNFLILFFVLFLLWGRFKNVRAIFLCIILNCKFQSPTSKPRF